MCNSVATTCFMVIKNFRCCCSESFGRIKLKIDRNRSWSFFITFASFQNKIGWSGDSMRALLPAQATDYRKVFLRGLQVRLLVLGARQWVCPWAKFHSCTINIQKALLGLSIICHLQQRTQMQPTFKLILLIFVSCPTIRLCCLSKVRHDIRCINFDTQ